MKSTKKIKWGIISTAKIGIEKVIPGIQKCTNSEAYAIASRNEASAKKAAKELSIPKYYGSYEALLANPHIDAIYNPLPNHMHIEWIKKSMEAGKHVLCEKPIGLNAKQAEEIIVFSEKFPELKLMEAFMYRFHPHWEKTKELISKGAIGDVVTVQSFFSYNNTNPNNIRNIKEYGGGSLLDIGCYCISFPRFLLNCEPNKVSGFVNTDPNFGTDRLVSAMLDFGNGRIGSFTCSTQLEPYQRMQVFGNNGRIEIEIPVNAPPDVPCKMWLQQNSTIKVFDFDPVDQYTLQCESFANSILLDKPVPTPLSDALANMKVIDAVFKSGLSRKWEQV